MPTIEIDISERAFRALQALEKQPGVLHRDAGALTTAAYETLGNLLAYQEENRHKGRMALTTHDEGRRHYVASTPLEEIIPVQLLLQPPSRG